MQEMMQAITNKQNELENQRRREVFNRWPPKRGLQSVAFFLLKKAFVVLEKPQAFSAERHA